MCKYHVLITISRNVYADVLKLIAGQQFKTLAFDPHCWENGVYHRMVFDNECQFKIVAEDNEELNYIKLILGEYISEISIVTLNLYDRRWIV